MVFSQQADLSTTLRWLGITSAQVPQLDMAASGGIHEPQDVVKAILAGATAVEICSAIYLQGESFIDQCTEFLTEWLESKGIPTIAEAKGRLNQKNVSDNSTFERAQFMRYYSSHEQ
jgi:dihydroorotate dehydrogenase (fumarate)